MFKMQMTSDKKFTGPTVIAAMKKILDKVKVYPATIQSDNGPEFKHKFSVFVKSYGIKQIFSETYSAQQNSFIERFNRTIKTLIGKY